MELFTLKIDPTTRDLVLDADGSFEQVQGDDAVEQAIRLTLLTWKEEFPLYTAHGTDYRRIMGKKPYELQEDEIAEVIREAIYQVAEVRQLDELEITRDGRTLSVAFAVTLDNGHMISMEVGMG